MKFRQENMTKEEVIKIHIEAPVFDPCPKFSPYQSVQNDMSRVVSYMYLKDKGISGKVFSQRKICKLDSTQTHDGPNHMLEIEKTSQKSINGWLNVGGNIDYKYNNGWKSSVSKIIEDKQEQQIARHFSVKEADMKHDYRARIKYLENYMADINNLYQGDLTTKVKQFRETYRKSREELKKYVKLNKVRMYEIIPLLEQTPNHRTLINQLKAFKPITELKLPQKQKYIDVLFKHIKRHEEQEESNDEADQELDVKTRTYSQMMQDKQEIIYQSQEFNQQHYLFELQSVASMGQQIRQNKMKQIVDDMFGKDKEFNGELMTYAKKKLSHIQPQNQILTNNLLSIQQVIISIKQKKQFVQRKELHRMCKSQSMISRKNSLHHSQLASTAATQNFRNLIHD